jgi:hypothetical protein
VSGPQQKSPSSILPTSHRRPPPFRLSAGLPECEAWQAASDAQYLRAGEFQEQEPGGCLLKFNLALIPGGNTSHAECLLFKIFALDGILCEAFSLNREPPLPIAAGRLFQKRPRPQDAIVNDSQIKVSPSCFVLVDHKSGGFGMHQGACSGSRNMTVFLPKRPWTSKLNLAGIAESFT